MDEALDSVAIARLQAHALVDAEARVFPSSKVDDDILVDFALDKHHLAEQELERECE